MQIGYLKKRGRDREQRPLLHRSYRTSIELRSDLVYELS